MLPNLYIQECENLYEEIKKNSFLLNDQICKNRGILFQNNTYIDRISHINIHYMDNIDDIDELLEDAVVLVHEKGKATIGMLQRTFKIGFNRAARIMDQLEEIGIVGSEEGIKPRQVYDFSLQNYHEEKVMYLQNLLTEINNQLTSERAKENNIGYEEKASSNLLKKLNGQYLIPNMKHSEFYDFCESLQKFCSPIFTQIRILTSEDIDILYNNISVASHTMDGVSLNIHKANEILSWADSEITNRISKFRELNVTSLEDYNTSNDKDYLLSRIYIVIADIKDINIDETYLEKILTYGYAMGVQLILMTSSKQKSIRLVKNIDDLDIKTLPEIKNICESLNNSPSEEISISINSIDNMNGYEFECFCAEILKQNGYKKVIVTSSSGDQGLDIIAERDKVRFGIQCKCYSNSVGNDAVQEAAAGKIYYQCHVGIVLTNSDYTPQAIDLAQKTGIVLWGREDLLKLMNHEEL